MTESIEVSQEEIDKLFEQLKKDAASGGYYLNPDIEFTKSLCRGLLTNEKRYGYQACPCRLAAKVKEQDIDIICPCDYRDADVVEFGACF
jgi:ferredoxin-thioredoxin reductase catalytic subunit